MLYYVYTDAGDSIDETLVAEGLAVAWTRDGQHRITWSASNKRRVGMASGVCGKGKTSMEAKILTTIALVFGLGSAIPIAIQLATEERTGDWITNQFLPKLERLARFPAMIASSAFLATGAVAGVGLSFVEDLPGPKWMEFIIVGAVGLVAGWSVFAGLILWFVFS